MQRNKYFLTHLLGRPTQDNQNTRQTDSKMIEELIGRADGAMRCRVLRLDHLSFNGLVDLGSSDIIWM